MGTRADFTVPGGVVVGGGLVVDTNTLVVDATNNRVGVGTASPTTALAVSGTVTATTFSGSGASLTSLDASQLTVGTVPSARVSGAYTGITSVGTLGTLSVTGTATAGTFAGSGASLTSVPAAQLSGTALPAGIVSSSLTSVGTLGVLSVTGTVTAGTFSGSGASLTAVPAAQLTGTALPSGIVSSSLTSVGTLSSLTVSGVLNVDTSTLVVDATNNRVGVNVVAPTVALDVSGTTQSTAFAVGSGTSAAPSIGFTAASTTGFSYDATNGLQVSVGGTLRARWGLGGNFVAGADATSDIGAAVTRWKDGFFSGTVTAATFSGSGASLTSIPVTALTATTWTSYTPTFTAGGTAVTVGTGGTITGAYVKVGRWVYAVGNIQVSTTAGTVIPTGNFAVGLPTAMDLFADSFMVIGSLRATGIGLAAAAFTSNQPIGASGTPGTVQWRYPAAYPTGTDTVFSNTAPGAPVINQANAFRVSFAVLYLSTS